MLIFFGFFPRGLAFDFGSKFKFFSKCVYGENGPGNEVWGCVKVLMR